MPLRAQVEGVWLNAALLSKPEWDALKARSIRMPCCEAPAYRRTSSLGTRHFVHSSGTHCGSPGESAEHLAAKAEIVSACRGLGWEVQSEFASENWRADVYATRGRHRVAFEIQWSPQTIEETRARHAAYGDVKCCWLFRKLPRALGSNRRARPTPERDLPIFELLASDCEFRVVIDHTQLPLRDFVEARLERRIRFFERRHYTIREVELITCAVGCWNCGTEYDVFYTRRFLRSDCGAEYVETWDPFDYDDPYGAFYNSSILKQLFACRAQDLRISVKRRWSNTMNEFYWSFGCPRCDAIFGAHFFRDIEADAENENVAPLCSQKVRCSKFDSDPHWCLPEHGSFCSVPLVPKE